MIKDICSALGCSKTTLLSSFKKAYKITVNSALNKVRLDDARKQLAAPNSPSINDVALSVGFSDQSYFCKVFSQEYGESPSEYKKMIEKKKIEEYSFLPSACTKK
jgi:AraC-like DNA-binding protein